jgi:hypothetical protein
MEKEHDTRGLGDDLAALTRLQMRDYFIATLGAMGISPQHIEQQSTVIDLWQERLAQLVQMGLDPTQLDEITQNFAATWFFNQQENALPLPTPNSR